MKFTQYLAQWHAGRRTITVINRAESKAWMIFQESGARSRASEPRVLSPEDMAGFEKFLAATCERHDHD